MEDGFKCKCQVCGHESNDEVFENPDGDIIKVSAEERETMSEEEVMEVLIHNLSEGTRCPVCGSNDIEDAEYDPYAEDENGGEQDFA